MAKSVVEWLRKMKVEVAEEADEGGDNSSPTPRGRPSRVSLPLHDGAHLDRAAETSCGDLRIKLDSGIKVVSFVEIEVAVQGFLGVDEGPVGRDRLAVLDSDCRGRLRWLQAVPRCHARSRIDGLVGVVDRLLFIFRESCSRLWIKGRGVVP